MQEGDACDDEETIAIATAMTAIRIKLLRDCRPPPNFPRCESHGG
jgi:hypothetical protein